jgi:hypothetical protein
MAACFHEIPWIRPVFCTTPYLRGGHGAEVEGGEPTEAENGVADGLIVEIPYPANHGLAAAFAVRAKPGRVAFERGQGCTVERLDQHDVVRAVGHALVVDEREPFHPEP